MNRGRDRIVGRGRQTSQGLSNAPGSPSPSRGKSSGGGSDDLIAECALGGRSASVAEEPRAASTSRRPRFHRPESADAPGFAGTNSVSQRSIAGTTKASSSRRAITGWRRCRLALHHVACERMTSDLLSCQRASFHHPTGQARRLCTMNRRPASAVTGTVPPPWMLRQTGAAYHAWEMSSVIAAVSGAAAAGPIARRKTVAPRYRCSSHNL